MLFPALPPRPISSTPLSLILPSPVLAGRITMIIYDRHSNPSPSDPLRGGDILLSQHPFRSPGHPEAHIPILPASGLISEIPTKYVQCSIFGRDPTLIALFVIGLLGRIV